MAPARPGQLKGWLAAGHHAGMEWLAETATRRATPHGLWPEVRSVIMLGMSYASDEDLLAGLGWRDRGVISLYARRRDYHDVIKGRLKTLAQFLVSRAGGDVKVFVDTAPVMEKPLAMDAGLGWQGKHTVLVSRSAGNWLFLGALYTTLDLPPDAPHADRCGSCTRCLSICPTAAFPAPYVLDARRCIAYLTNEHQGAIPVEFRAAIGNRIFGCDDCLAVCPWNKFASASRDARLALRGALALPPLDTLARLDDAGFRALFAGTPVKRLGHARFLRNVLIAIGNSGEARLIPVALDRLDHASALVRGMAVWALARLMGPAEFARLAATRQAGEIDPGVRDEWAAGRSVCAE
jgi:epoxyqueuosine reductase